MFTRRVEGLIGPARYRAMVRFKWLDARGKTILSARRFSKACRQPDHRPNLKVKALSHTEKFDKKQELVIALEKVMEECLDQEEPVRFDPEGNSSANVTRAAREHSLKQGGNIVVSIPLRRRDDAMGARFAHHVRDRGVRALGADHVGDQRQRHCTLQ